MSLDLRNFMGVAENPTETIVGNLKEYMKKKGPSKGLVIGSCNVLETAGRGAIAPLYKILESAVNGENNDNSEGERVIWVSLAPLSHIYFGLKMNNL